MSPTPGEQLARGVTAAAVTLEAPPVVALYVRPDGPYPGLGVDIWDEARDATRYDGPYPVVAHPPCAPWGSEWQRSTQRAELAVRAVQQVQRWGGALEHPAASRLWQARGLPRPGDTADRWGGITISVLQSRFGHAAPKPTWLYLVRVRAPLVVPPCVDDPQGRVRAMKVDERERSPVAFALWLVELARTVKTGNEWGRGGV